MFPTTCSCMVLWIPWFKTHYPLKHLKKSVYWRLAEHRVLRDASAVLFTCDEEQRLAGISFRPYGVRGVVVGYGIAQPPGHPSAQKDAFLERHDSLRGQRRLLFLSRIHPKKGCDLLIEAFAKAAQHDDSLRLVMAGPDELGWQSELQGLARARGVDSRIVWTGMLTGDEKWGAYRQQNAFVLPSHSENFGIVVAEPLACGVPVLITRRVNIWPEIARAGANLWGMMTCLERRRC